MSDPALLVRARRLRAAHGVVVARDVTLAAAPGDVVVPGTRDAVPDRARHRLRDRCRSRAAGRGRIGLLHLAAAVFGAGIGSLLAPIERAGWRLLTAAALYLVLFVVRGTPMTPLLRLSTRPATLATPAGGPGAWLFLPGLALMAVAALLAARLRLPGVRS
jgi:hypothetical protein